MDKIVAVWNGWAGGPGYSNFYFGGGADGAQLSTAADRVYDFFQELILLIPSGITITIQPTAQEIASADGTIVAERPITTVPATIVGLGSTSYSSPSGACVTWRTTTTVNGRVLKGKTFIVPIGSNCYDVDGTLVANRLSELRIAATNLASPGSFATEEQLQVWSRPFVGTPGNPARAGSNAPTVSATVSDRAAILRSRRA